MKAGRFFFIYCDGYLWFLKLLLYDGILWYIIYYGRFLSMANENAYLSNEGCYTIFTFGENRLKFISPYSLQYYKKVLKWDNGYIEVLTKYAHQDELIEEYIDLIPILKNLYMEPDEFLKHIKSVEVVNA